MARSIQVMIESGKKKVVASAFDWPGWERNAKSEQEALAALEGYRPRYAKVAKLARLAQDFGALGSLRVVERVDGSTTTDFFGISVRSAAAEQGEMTSAECERKIALLRASWAYFDYVTPRVSAEMRKGQRGGGRDRDQIISHTLGTEPEFSKKIGVITPREQVRDPKGLRAHREAYCDAIRE